MRMPNMIVAATICLFSQQSQADDFRVLDLGSSEITNNHPWMEIIADQASWEEFYFERLLQCQVANTSLVDENSPCYGQAPTVDFETEQVVVGGLGSKPSTAYDILVSSVDSTTDEQRITVIDFNWCVGLTIIDYPTAAVVVPRTEKPVSVYVEQGAAICE